MTVPVVVGYNSISKCANIPKSIRILETHIPGDGIRRANWDNLVESRLINWVSLWVSNWSGERVCERSKGSCQSGEKSVLHFEEKKKILNECEAVGARQKLKPEGEEKIFLRRWL